jgi:hypothetical protein
MRRLAEKHTHELRIEMQTCYSICIKLVNGLIDGLLTLIYKLTIELNKF